MLKRKISVLPLFGKLYEFLRHQKHKRQQKLLKKNAGAVTNHLYEVLQDEPISYFYIYGSLLGIIREKQFLSHDIDIDLGILDISQQQVKDLIHKLQSAGFRLIRYCEQENTVTEFTCQYGGIPIDFFLFQTEGDMMISYEYYRREDLTYPNDETTSIARLVCRRAEGFIDMPLYGTPLRVPRNYEQILCDQYGVDWRVPNTNWKNTEAPNRFDCGDKRGRYVNL
ncbi:hypothetical protein [Anaeromassilibacillus sp. SJQ-5]